MSSSSSFNKKRPPKLSPIILDPPSCAENDATSNSTSGTTLDSTAKVNIEDKQGLIISPQSLDIVQHLGRGQYGTVEKVRHKETGYYFAVKLVPIKNDDDYERRRLLMDVDILVKSSNCENIIKFYGALMWEGDLWILMELMDCSLDKFYKLAHRKVDTPMTTNANLSFITTKKDISDVGPCNHVDDENQLGNCDSCNPIPEKVLGRMSKDILNALSYLYSIQVIHRDIKPSNILINRSGVIKLCDFGISGYLVNSVARTYDAGCRPYMAPERIDPPKDRAGYDIKSDVWSFGITMLEMATGRYPYNHARGFFEQLKAICSSESPTLPKGKFSPVFDDFIGQCLQRDFQHRPKYDKLSVHPFVTQNSNVDISQFTMKVLK